MASYQVSDNLFLVEQQISSQKLETKPTEIPTNHIVIIDCSGSMSCDLPNIRSQLKLKLPKLLGEKDTISIIWFSGKGQFGTLLEAELVSTLSDLNQVNQAIDRWLKPVCLTGFKEPLEEAAKLVERVARSRPGTAFSLFFMSDGCDNCWPRQEILKTVEKASGGLSAATFVEYGYYADRQLLTSMAEKASGTLIFSEDFNKYAPQFEAAMQKRPLGVKRVEVKVTGDPIGGFAFSLDNSGDILTFSVENGKVSVPEGVNSLAYLSQTAPDPYLKLQYLASIASVSRDDLPGLSIAYAATSLFAVRMKSDVVFPLLKALGDVALIDKFASCYGKQQYAEFTDMSKDMAVHNDKRLSLGYDPNKVPAEDAFTILDLLRLLSDDDGNRLLMEHPSFKYSPIGRGRVDASEYLTAEEQAEIQSLTEQMASEKNAKKVAELAAKVASITANKPSALKFEADPAPDGYSISNLTFNENRPNVSIW